jgi:hypothetical protein
MRKHSATGELVPDDRFTVPVYDFTNARVAHWPKADFIVGNPPFIGNKRMRAVLGDRYVEALRSNSPDLGDAADYVMFWWNRAAELVRAGEARRFGMITTNSITQGFSRRVVSDPRTPPVEARTRVA